MTQQRPVASNWNFGDILDGVARTVPGDRPAVVQGNRVLTWQDLDARSNRLARALFAAGLQPGDRVAILARNAIEFIEIVAATYKARMSWVNINYRYTSSEVEYVLADSQSRALFYQEEFAEIVGPVEQALPQLALVVPIGADGAYEAVAGQGDGSPLGIERSPEDCYLLYTGGTTGKPKGVVWRMGDARAVQLESPTVKAPPATMAEHLAAVAANPAPGRIIPACPLMHGAGTNSSIAELMSGGTVILLENRGFDAAELWDAASRWGATRILIVGDVFARPMAEALAAHPGRWNLSPLRLISSAGLMWSREVKAALVEALPAVTLMDILGASEASNFAYSFTTATAATPTGLFEAAPTTVLVAPDYSRILDSDDPGPGLLARKAPFAVGYHDDPEKTAATYREIDGVLLAVPGDMAERTEDGRLRLIGRDSMVINTGGEKVFVEEVEEALKRAPGIVDAIVVGAPDDKWGKVIVALVETAAAFDEAEVRTCLLRELAPYKLPKCFIRLDEVPRHASGKGDYRRAAAIAAEA
ncbi:MAG TPA: AMP-binding protein [Novosphingobium sp.]|nr:AMP-binding protein [Novosphingobium sp.]HPZ46366.1 AMP-binding protein [Novosphingobium sp.]HQD98734.1 AMP-binding protein [Novosphingobium sp.]